MNNAITIARMQGPPRTVQPTAPVTPVEQKLVGTKAQDGLNMYDFRPGGTPRFTFGGEDKPMMGIAKNDLKGALVDWGSKALDSISGNDNTQSLSVKDAGPLAKYDHNGDGNISREEAGVALFAMTSYNAGGMRPLIKSDGKVDASDLTAAGTEANVKLAKSMFDVLYPEPETRCNNRRC